jgi:hypothetical protein
MSRKILLVLLAILAVALLVGLALPTAFDVERGILVQAAPARVHALVGDLRRWPEWTPWQESDQGLVVVPGAASTGVGASQSWTDSSGSGRLVFTRCDEAGIAYDMVFGGDGEELPAKGEIRYAPEGGATRVTWRMQGDFAVPVVGGWLRLAMIGFVEGDFDKGLAKLKRVAESP